MLAHELTVLKAVSKPQLRKGRSYVVKTMDLDTSLRDAGITTHVDLNYWEPEGTSSVMQCLFWPPSANVPFDRFYARAGFVPSTERRTAVEAWRHEGLPELIDWMQSICALPSNSTLRSREATFEAIWRAGELFVVKHPNRS
jgi:hypothetical protein